MILVLWLACYSGDFDLDQGIPNPDDWPVEEGDFDDEVIVVDDQDQVDEDSDIVDEGDDFVDTAAGFDDFIDTGDDFVDPDSEFDDFVDTGEVVDTGGGDIVIL